VKRLHMHVRVDDLEKAVRFYSDLFEARPCCGGTTYANWRVDDPPLNLAASTGHGPAGVAHFGLEVDSPADLQPVDRALPSPIRSAAAVPWEVSVRRQPVRKEHTP
jgi:catechol 2,3-dioxygenase-like lactoylglutathione lyase family enzyme